MPPADSSPPLADSSTIPPDICGERINPDLFLQELKKDATLYHDYLALSKHLQQEFLNFCTGNAGLKISYAPFFKYVFDPSIVLFVTLPASNYAKILQIKRRYRLN